MKHILAFILAVGLTTHATAKDNDPVWGHIADVEGGLTIHGKYDSYVRMQEFSFVTVRYTTRNAVNFYIAAISDSTCDAGQGTLVILDLQYNPLRRNDYVRRGGNGTSAVGDLLCNVVRRQRERGTNL
jgi:hypothetical protein